MKIVFTGIQGCGKGTQARLLRDRHDFEIVEMGAEFRREISSGSELGNKLQSVLDAGNMVNDELGAELMRSVLENHKEKENIIFDGFIRVSWNKEVFESIIDEYQVLFFHLDENKAKERLLGRMFNPKTGETFPVGVSVDPKTGDELIHRSDDSQEGILQRIQEYVDYALPLVDMQREVGIVTDIDADQDMEDVYTEIVEKLSLS